MTIPRLRAMPRTTRASGCTCSRLSSVLIPGLVDAHAPDPSLHSCVCVATGPSYGVPTGQGGPGSHGKPVFDVLGRAHGMRCCIVDRPSAAQRYAIGSASAIQVGSDADAAREAGKSASRGTYSLLVTQFMDLAMWLAARAAHRRQSDVAWMPQDTAAQGAPPSAVQQHVSMGKSGAAAAAGASTESKDGKAEDDSSDTNRDGEYGGCALDGVLRGLDANVGKVWGQLPANTLLIVATGQGDTAEVDRLRVRTPHGSLCIAAYLGAPWMPYDDTQGWVATIILFREQSLLFTRRGASTTLCDAVSSVAAAAAASARTVVRAMRAMQEQKMKRAGIEGAAPWRAHDQAMFNALCDSAVKGLMFAAVKPQQDPA